MSIDWITVAAQIANFLVLVWLLKRFLYRPILDGIDAREREIAARMAEAATLCEAAEAAKAEHKAEIVGLQSGREDLLAQAREAAEAERDAVLRQARERLERERLAREEERIAETCRFRADLQHKGATALVALTRKALNDLAGETLEERIVARAATRLSQMTGDLTAAAGDGREAVITTRDTLGAPPPEPRLSEIGRVAEIGDGIAVVTGLARALADELLEFEGGLSGVVFDLEPDRLGVVLLGPSGSVVPGTDVRRTGRVASVAVGASLLGRVVDALGRPRDECGPVTSVRRRPIEIEARDILSRAPVSRPLATGLKAVDAAVPVGLGQRELIIGDRQTGKTSIAIDTILNQKNTGVLCIYCAIGQRGDAVAKAIGAIRDGAMLENTIIMVAGEEEAPGLAFVAPYGAMTIAEVLAADGRDVLIVFDDLTHHAQSYRELSLLLRRPPGREAFPGDIFYVHARLLERSGQFVPSAGGGSITALPVVETQAENLSAYIPTNLISITDGQIYLSPRLVRRNQFHAVDLGVSVSRVGGKAQARAFRDVAGNLRVTLSQFEEMEEFAGFGTRLDDDTRKRLVRGAAVRAALRQPERDPMSGDEQLAVLLSAMDGVFDGMTEARIATAMDAVRAAVRRDHDETGEIIRSGHRLDDNDRARIVDAARSAVSEV